MGGNKKDISKAVVLTTLLLFSFTMYSTPLLAQSSSNTIIVDINGSGDFYSITAAVAAANNGDTILVYDGVYLETDIVVEKSISLIGEDASTTMILGDGSRTILALFADNIQLSQFTISNGGNMMDACIVIVANDCQIFDNKIEGSNDMGIALHNSTGCIIENNLISDCSSVGIRLYGENYDNIIRNNLIKNNVGSILSETSDNNFYENNTIETNTYGMILFYSSSNTIEQNHISNSEEIGIWAYDNSNQNTINNNQIETNHIGIQIDESSNNIITENILSLNSDGIKFMTSTSNTCSSNEILDSSAGIYLYQSQNIQIEENLISACAKGIYIEESTGNTVIRNQLTSNEQGVFASYADNNLITENDFISNVEHAKFTTWLSPTGLQISSWKANYWDNSLGIFPKIIPGILFIKTNDPIGIFFPWISIDWNPSSTPYH